jgi:hypothetical protein
MDLILTPSHRLEVVLWSRHEIKLGREHNDQTTWENESVTLIRISKPIPKHHEPGWCDCFISNESAPSSPASEYIVAEENDHQHRPLFESNKLGRVFIDFPHTIVCTTLSNTGSAFMGYLNTY